MTTEIGNDQVFQEYYKKGVSYRTAGRYKEAIEQYTNAIRLQPNDTMVYFRRGITYKLTNKLEEAIADFNRSIHLDPNYNRVYIERAITLDLLGHVLDAIIDLTKSLELMRDAEAELLLQQLHKKAFMDALGTMFPVERNGKEYQVSKHKEWGTIVYDSNTQRGVNLDLQARLFIFESKQRITRNYRDIYQGIVPVIIDIPGLLTEELTNFVLAVNFYHNLLLKQRVTHCYRCKSELDSLDFDICKRCGWIRCTCGACGCQYKGP